MRELRKPSFNISLIKPLKSPKIVLLIKSLKEVVLDKTIELCDFSEPQRPARRRPSHRKLHYTLLSVGRLDNTLSTTLVLA